MATQIDWKKLVEGISALDESAITEFIQLTQDKLYFFAKTITKNDGDAEDACQNAYIRIIEKIGNIRDSEAIEAWSMSIVRNEALMIIRKKKNEVIFSDNKNDNETVIEIKDERIDQQPELSFDYDQKLNMIDDIIECLPDDQRIVVMLHYFENLKLSEIASALDVSENTIKSRLNYAKQKIKEKVKDYERKYDIRLYNIAPFPFFIWLLQSLQKDMEFGNRISDIGMVVSAEAILTHVGIEQGANAVAGNASKSILKGGTAQATKTLAAKAVLTLASIATIGYVGYTSGIIPNIYHYLFDEKPTMVCYYTADETGIVKVYGELEKIHKMTIDLTIKRYSNQFTDFVYMGLNYASDQANKEGLTFNCDIDENFYNIYIDIDILKITEESISWLIEMNFMNEEEADLVRNEIMAVNDLKSTLENDGWNCYKQE